MPPNPQLMEFSLVHFFATYDGLMNFHDRAKHAGCQQSSCICANKKIQNDKRLMTEHGVGVVWLM